MLLRMVLFTDIQTTSTVYATLHTWRISLDRHVFIVVKFCCSHNAYTGPHHIRYCWCITDRMSLACHARPDQVVSRYVIVSKKTLQCRCVARHDSYPCPSSLLPTMSSASPQVQTMQTSVTYKQSYIRDSLRAVLLQVVSKLSDCGESVGGLNIFRVMSNDDGLASLVGDNALLALVSLSILVSNERDGECARPYLLCLEAIFVCLDGHVFYAVYLDTLRDDLLRFRPVAERFGNGCSLCIGQLYSVSIWMYRITFAHTMPLPPISSSSLRC